MIPRKQRPFDGSRLSIAAALLFAIGLAACRPAADPPADEALARARQAADALTAELAGTLGEELQRGGPAAAIKVCSEVAPEVAAAHSQDGLTVRRVSLRARNPADRPDDFERARLEAWERSHPSGETAAELVEVTEEAGARELRVLRPIYVASVCLKCHGDPAELAPEVRQILGEKYPEDPAVGYRVGDLRGAVSVRVALDGD